MKGPKILPSLKPDRKVHLHKRNADTGFLGKTTKCRYVTKIFLVGGMRFPSKPCSVRCISWHPWPGCHIPPMKRGDTQRKYFTVTDTGKIIENGEHWKIRHSLSFVINVRNRGIFTRKPYLLLCFHTYRAWILLLRAHQHIISLSFSLSCGEREEEFKKITKQTVV